MPKNEERILAAAIYVISFFAPVLGPLVIWLLKREESSFIDYHGKEYFNFMISYFVYTVISGILTLILIGFIGLWLSGILIVVFTIVAGIKAYEGTEYRIPWIFRLIK
ncbi:DUF4870 domain-containing protein [Neobacillus sp. PS3-12]|uniref:DUF4870 domain-containing protein n=1 Tax=Neobacillus sp. PS3-12 TaxID=3070677 RepID=UPI0027DFB820|nr:DUF4870 domain-containing protein [Neobacillus sp. PS3-12]WML53757.1 DUF4870 domain-containing protein [Neobacillus sp. PS3-12]